MRIARNLGDLEAEVNYVYFHRDLKVVAYAISGDQGGCQGRPGSLYACLGLQQLGVEPLMDLLPLETRDRALLTRRNEDRNVVSTSVDPRSPPMISFPRI